MRQRMVSLVGEMLLLVLGMAPAAARQEATPTSELDGLGLASARASEILAHTAIDFLLIDTQHGSWGAESTIETLTAIATGRSVPMARVARNDYTMIGRLLDEGAMGIVVPMVHTAEDARAAAAASRFPPLGERSWGWGRAMHIGSDYPDMIDEQIFLAVQIESAQAVENAEAILSTPGVDGCWIGPSDLALSMGLHPRDALGNQQFLDAVESVLQICNTTGKAAGYACSSPAQALGLAERGFQFLTINSDVGMLMQAAAGALTETAAFGGVKEARSRP